MPDGDTIAALSTPAGESAIALIRLSGPACPELARAVGARAPSPTPRRATLGRYRGLDGAELDECVWTFYEAGASFTGEAMLEIACHGNPLIVQKILEDLLARGCRAAEPGEFTRTAFMNGRMDLSQAEAVADLIRTRSDRGLEVARRQLHGAIGRKMGKLTDRLLGIMAEVEAYIDFPEEDLPPESRDGPARDLRALIGELDELIETRHYCALLHEGVKTLIVGGPNVGKSSLINALLGTERAIVSEMPGTTRDFISDHLMLGPWRIEIMDTAGLREASDAIERIGIEHTIEQAETADFFLLVLDSAAPSPTLPVPLLGRMTPANTLVVENKTDLEESRSHADFLKNHRHCRVSLKKRTGLTVLREQWRAALDTELKRPAATDGVVVNARHAAALSGARAALRAAAEKMRTGDLSELIAADLRAAIDGIGEVVGRVDNERMLDTLFQRFCIGK